MKKRHYIITILMLSAMLAGCGADVPDVVQESNISTEAVGTGSESIAMAAEYSFVEVNVSQSVLPVEEYYDLYFDMNQLLDKRFELENELLSGSFLNDREIYTVKEATEEHATTYLRVEIDGAPVTWKYYEDRAKEIYTDDYIENIFNPYYIKDGAILFKEVNGSLYRITADNWSYRMDRDSMQIARYGDNYLVWGYIYYFEDMRDTVLYYVKPNADKPFGLEIELRTVISAD